jgi:hypothetical protein
MDGSTHEMTPVEPFMEWDDLRGATTMAHPPIRHSTLRIEYDIRKHVHACMSVRDNCRLAGLLDAFHYENGCCEMHPRYCAVVFLCVCGATSDRSILRTQQQQQQLAQRQIPCVPVCCADSHTHTSEQHGNQYPVRLTLVVSRAVRGSSICETPLLASVCLANILSYANDPTILMVEDDIRQSGQALAGIGMPIRIHSFSLLCSS